ncbi:MAG TPA: hypothetical protein VFY41_05715 [Nitrososphaeraceae archaeon]|nr:hypothetical protein [Nitrososphaeraceae archaeon]
MITGSTIMNYVKAIKLFCDVNDILIPCKKITCGLPNGRRYADYRVPTIDEIIKIIQNYSSDKELVKHIDSEHPGKLYYSTPEDFEMRLDNH